MLVFFGVLLVGVTAIDNTRVASKQHPIVQDSCKPLPTHPIVQDSCKPLLTHPIVQNSCKPLLTLRGGLGGLERTNVAKAATLASLANAAVMYLSPSRAAQLYRIETPSGLLFWQMELMAAAMLQVHWGAWLALTGTDVHRAIGWSSIFTTIQTTVQRALVS